MDRNRHGLFVVLVTSTFLLSFVGSVVFKLSYKPKALQKYHIKWGADVGTVYKDISYGDKESNIFDMYLPNNTSKSTYGLVVYLHAGGFTSGDKEDDSEMLEWLCSKGYVAVGVNYTLRNDVHPEANIYLQSQEIKQAIPRVIQKAKEYKHPIDQMAIGGGSAGGCLALLYAYRDAKDAPVPVKMVFEAVGPSSFYPEDWQNYGFDKNTEEAKKAAASLFSVMSEKHIDPTWFGSEKYDAEIKDISPLLWVDENTVPTVMAYGVYDIVQPYLSSLRLHEALKKNKVKHEYIVMEHSGHGLQNDDQKFITYMQKVEEYLDIYMS